MKAKKTYSAPAVEVVPVAMNSVVMWSGPGQSATMMMYGLCGSENWGAKDKDGYYNWE